MLEECCDGVCWGRNWWSCTSTTNFFWLDHCHLAYVCNLVRY
jgi:hypothetical protein